MPKFTADHPFADPERAVRKPVEIANATEAVHDARFCIECINEQFLKAVDHQPNTLAGIERAIANGWLWRHESGTYVKFTRRARTCSPDDWCASSWSRPSNYPAPPTQVRSDRAHLRLHVSKCFLQSPFD